MANTTTTEAPRLIRDWKELATVPPSATHWLDINPDDGCGWIRLINGKDWTTEDHYLSTHTFYGSTHKRSTELLRKCGFNVTLGNWDEPTPEPLP